MDGVNDVVNNIVNDGMGDALSSILSNPELMSKISAIASSLSGGGTDSAAATSPVSVADAHPPGNAAPSGLASALNNPALLSKLPEVMATLAPILSDNTPGGGDNNAEHKRNDRTQRSNSNERAAPASSEKTDSHGRAHRTALLCALKPYMSPRRREAIDYIIKIDRIGDLLHSLT